AEDEKSSKPTSSLVLPSLPEDVIIDILACSSRCDYPKPSLVSKHFRSLIASPDLQARRSLLACTEHCLYVVFYQANTMDLDMWSILRRKANGSRCLTRISSTLPVLDKYSTTSAAVGSRIYVFGGRNHKNMTTNAFCIDCRSHTVEPLPSILVPLFCKFAGFIHGKIYVMGYCSPYREKAMLMFDTETQMWELIEPYYIIYIELNIIDDIAIAGGRKRLRNLAPRNSCGSTFLGQPDPSASTSGTSSDFFDEINLNA
uniref:Uncharacterized protein n=1 Tax=Brassica oleracea var. oleracea TaxID=109376 RepID=A0A0D3BTC2_BRAOL